MGIKILISSVAALAQLTVASFAFTPVQAERKVAIWQKQAELAGCESSFNPLAVNPHDKDGTASLGKYQFKRGTWKYYVQKYDLFDWRDWSEEQWERSIWDEEKQDIVVSKMFKDKDVDMQEVEFPDCAKKLGLRKNYHGIEIPLVDN